MSRSILVALAAAVALAAPAARADIPPPRPEVAGLSFEPSDADGPSHGRLVLSRCFPAHANCQAARRAGVVGAVVTRVNGAPLHNVWELRNAFRDPPHGKVRLTFEVTRTKAGAPVTQTVDVDFAP